MLSNQKLVSLQQSISTRGINVVVGTTQQKMEEWLSWFRGNVNDFHYYKTKRVDGKSIEMEKFTLSMAKVVCEDRATMLWNDRCSIQIEPKQELEDGEETSDLPINEQLTDVLKMNNFNNSFTDFVEEYMALGNGVCLQYIHRGKVRIEFVTGNNLLITSAWNGNVNGVLVLNESEVEIDKKIVYRTHVQNHFWCDETQMYRVTHSLYESKDTNELGKSIPIVDFLGDEIENYILVRDENSNEIMEAFIEYQTPRPLFQFYKPTMKNNFDLGSPNGISIFANGRDILKSIDNIYDAKNNETLNGKLMTFIDQALTEVKHEVNTDGAESFIRYVDKDNTSLIALPGMMGENGTQSGVVHVAPVLRYDNYKTALDEELNNLSRVVGLGTSFYKTDGKAVTATEVISSNSDTYKKLVKEQLLVGNNLEKMAKNLLCLIDNVNKEVGSDLIEKDNDVKIKFDDSIQIDDEERRKAVLDEFNNGARSLYSYLTDKYGRNMTHMDAEKEIERIREAAAIANPFMDDEGNPLDNIDDEDEADDEEDEEDLKDE